MTNLLQSVEQFIKNNSDEWGQLVDIGLALKFKQLRSAAQRLGALTGRDPSGLLQKLKAIHFARELQKSPDLIKRIGPKILLRDYNQVKRTKKLSVLSWRVTPALRDAVHGEVLRIAQDINLRTSEEFWTWLLAEMRQWTKLELRHSAGEISRYEKIKT